ncbi:hypothetical protein WR25_18247 isoform C [Diploscapter pachys]|uniref:Junctophilin n=1 Tax=Diploscapter pachys TaxID=2018661 RepID=A0A2A2LW93_9BILA|nr:hypothetical protein WR25_18247 isoform A [Diploscapter pachys]PAV90256.1 hypothetical protein WR25_18247 isoform B [Diploscapter pachys]PAV90257.1 hypothetical protein WR25_18247 isoform C [Diploscapter pachys]
MSNTVAGSLRSSGSTMSCTSEDSIHHRGLAPPEEEVVDDHASEVYSGEWKNDARSGFGICERSDGLRYQGEWANNAKNGYGVTTLRDGTREEGKYKNNVLVVSARRKGVLFVRSGKLKERVEGAIEAATRAASIAQQKADIAASRTSTADERAERAGYVATQSRDDAIQARLCAKQFDPSFKQPGTETLRRQLRETHGGESFGTDLSDPLSYSRHLSQTHSKQASFEQNLSVDLTDPSAFMTPIGAAPSQIGAGGPMVAPNMAVMQAQGNTPIMSNHVGHNQIGNHVNFNLPPHLQQQGLDAIGGNPQSMQPPPVSLQQSQAQIGGYNPQQQIYTPAQLQQLQQQQQFLAQQQQMLTAQQQQGGQPQFYSGDVYPQQAGTSNASQPHIPHMVNAQGQPIGQQPYQVGDGQMGDSMMTESMSQSQQMETSATSLGPSTSQAGDLSQASVNQSGLQANLRNQQQQSSSRFSLSDDHYDQYVITESGQPRLRRNRPSLMRQNDVNDPSSMLNRRSTLASSRDRKVDPSSSPESQENMGSLPNLAELETGGVRLRREEAARLASQRRQEVLRDQEEQELLRANPLRYLFHPGLRAWLLRWKVPLLLAAINLSLVYFLFKLLTYEKRTGGHSSQHKS